MAGSLPGHDACSIATLPIVITAKAGIKLYSAPL